MTASDLLALQASGARFEIAGDKVRLIAPRGLVTTEVQAALRRFKPEIIKRLARRCPFCKTRDRWRTIRTLVDGICYYDSRCPTCDGLIEVYIPAALGHLVKADLAS